MTNNEILSSAIKMLGSSVTEEQKAEYESRATYIIAAFCTESEELDARYRKANGLEKAAEANKVFLPLMLAFPRADRFATTAAYYVAAMLTIDENAELSDKFFDKYCDGMARIETELPASIEKISQTYH